MPDGRSTFLLDAEINLIFRNTAFAPPANLYVSGHIDDPGRTGANELVAATNLGYVRKAISTIGEWEPPFDSEGGRATFNINDILFAVATADWDDLVKYAGLWTAAAAGDFLYGGLIDADGLSIVQDQSLLIPAGSFIVVEGSNLT